jgi:hypothetical protein
MKSVHRVLRGTGPAVDRSARPVLRYGLASPGETFKGVAARTVPADGLSAIRPAVVLPLQPVFSHFIVNQLP